ncbi:aminoglycoside phosphotransferase family protein [Kitasatospora sp. NPDC088346]|uniref:aminoglycoside phosphotransferase family protein n=1 Tax=Kitasatospora sp. NPDC088346 TaxID=3364073 RepID=UPI00381FFD32
MTATATAPGSVPVVRSTRRPWTALPAALRSAVEARLGSPVAAARSQSGGFSRGAASRLRCADGGRAFVKAVSLDGDPVSARLYEQEAAVAAALPGGLPVPAFRGLITEGGWTALLFDDVPGRTPSVPWRAADLDAVLPALTRLTAVAADRPAPGLSRWGGALADWVGWNHLLARGDALADVPSWARPHAERLAALEAGFPEAAYGDAVLHSDLRSDNILVRRGSVTFVDWAWAARGQDWIDPMIFALCAAVQGVADPDALFLRHPAARRADPEAVDALLAALAGRFTTAARQPTDWGTAPIRAFQRAEAATALHWLGRRRTWYPGAR